jgi:hypothetical protein
MLPGMVLGLKTPNSNYQEGKDMNGKPIDFTHVAIYLGNDSTDLWFAHQNIAKTYVETAADLAQRGYEPRAVIAPNN